MLKGTTRAVKRARVLRKAMSLPEVLLWKQLRLRPDKLKFRRQHPAGRYVLDFYCETARLCVEVDGSAHDFGNRPANDQCRDAWLGEHGIRTLRIAARDVLHNLDGVVLVVIAECRARPLHHSAMPSGTPPLQGGF
jgi:very-short-patch-repair endonuclease